MFFYLPSPCPTAKTKNGRNLRIVLELELSGLVKIPESASASMELLGLLGAAELDSELYSR